MTQRIETPTDELRARALEILGTKAVRHFDEPIQLASGKMSNHFVDGKAGLAEAADLEVACATIHAMVADAGIDYDAVGGLTLGADHVAVGTAIAARGKWFFVRKEPKGRGTGRQIEGADIGPGWKVLAVEDVVSTGGSLFQAIDIIAATGAEVVAAATLIDRGEHARGVMADRGIPYFSIGTYADFGLPPVE